MSSDRIGHGTLAAFGCYTPATGGRGNGIALARLCPERIDLIAEVAAPSPSFLAWAPGAANLYAAHETPAGSIGAYRIGRDGLEAVGEVSSEGGRPCHIAVHPSGRFVACANYAGGTFASRAVRKDGSLGATTSIVRHTGAGPHPTRQSVPHPHTVHFSSDGNRAFLTDISLDTVSVHRVDVDRQGLESEPVQVLQMPRGSGPRHLVALTGDTVVVVHEIDATLSVVRDARDGLALVASGHRTSGDGPDAWPSEVAAWGPCRVVVGNRNAATLAIHRVDTDTGEFTLEHEIPVAPANIRHLSVVGDHAYVALQDGDAVVAVNLVSGDETARVDTGSPACISPQLSR